MKSNPFSGMDSVFYNNAVSVPLLFVSVHLSGESYAIQNDRHVPPWPFAAETWI